MKRLLQKYIAIILCIGLLSACKDTVGSNTTVSDTIASNNDTGKNVAMGRYIEMELSFPDNLSQIITFVKRNGNFEVFAKNKEQKLESYKSQDGTNWEKQAYGWIDELNKTDVGWITSLDYDKDGNIYFIKLGDTATLNSVKDNATVEEIPIKWNSKNPYPIAISILADGSFLVGDASTGVEHYSKDGEFIMGYTGNIYYDSMDLPIFENQIAVLDMPESNVNIYNIETGEVIRTVSYKGMSNSDDVQKISFDSKGALYLSNRKGLHHMTLEGSLWERMIEGDMTSLSMPALYATKIIIDDNNEFLYIFEDSGIYTLKKFVYSADTPTVPSNEVTIYMLQDSFIVRQIAGEYQNAHPETRVSVNVAMSEENSATKSDIIRTLNTELLNGKGADLILLDGLPIDSYIQKGVLLDISKDITGGDLNTTLLNTYSQDSKLYALPLRYKLPTMLGSNEIVNSVKTLDDLVAWQTANPTNKLFVGASWSDLINEFYITSSPAWLSNRQLDNAKFTAFLESIKSLTSVYDKAEVEKTYTGEDGSEQLLPFVAKNGIIDFAFNDFPLYFETFGSFDVLEMPIAALEKRQNSSYALKVGQSEGVYEPKNIIAINANSENKEIAVEILKMAVSETIQDTNFYDAGFPINNKSFEKGIAKQPSYSVGGGGDERSLDTTSITPEYRKECKETLSQLTKQLKTPSTIDDIFLQMIIDETKGYFEDTKTVQEAVEAVTKRAQAYFAE